VGVHNGTLFFTVIFQFVIFSVQSSLRIFAASRQETAEAVTDETWQTVGLAPAGACGKPLSE
jgi:hypothetical protein